MSAFIDSIRLSRRSKLLPQDHKLFADRSGFPFCYCSCGSKHMNICTIGKYKQGGETESCCIVSSSNVLKPPIPCCQLTSLSVVIRPSVFRVGRHLLSSCHTFVELSFLKVKGRSCPHPLNSFNRYSQQTPYRGRRQWSPAANSILAALFRAYFLPVAWEFRGYGRSD